MVSFSPYLESHLKSDQIAIKIIDSYLHGAEDEISPHIYVVQASLLLNEAKSVEEATTLLQPIIKEIRENKDLKQNAIMDIAIETLMKLVMPNKKN